MAAKPDTRQTRMFRNGRYNTAIRFPADWKIEPTTAEISYDGHVITVRPIDETLTDIFDRIAARTTPHEQLEDPAHPPAEPVDF